MNDTEREAIVLNSAWEMIDGMVNWAMFEKTDNPNPSHLLFKTTQHAQLFAILLGDFLSEIKAFKGEPIPFDLAPAPSQARPSDLTFLFHLRQVCSKPQLGRNASSLSFAIEEFGKWLEQEFVATDVNLDTIDIVADIRVTRYRYIKMCGDIAKHNLARLATNVGHLRNLLSEAGHSVTEQQAYRAIERFFAWFHDDIFHYHSSQIAELLNNVRWAIFEYLTPEFLRSHHLSDKSTESFPIYSYRIPEAIVEPIAVEMYWNAMNRVRSKPYVHRFTIPDYMMTRY